MFSHKSANMKLSIMFVSAALISFVSLTKAIDEVAVVSKFDQYIKETKEEHNQHRGLQLELNQRWKDRIDDAIIVPYTIATTFTALEIDLIDRSVKEIGDRSEVVKFVRRSTQKAYILVRNDAEGCNSHVGRGSWGTSQTINLSRLCMQAGIIQHEFLHEVRVH